MVLSVGRVDIIMPAKRRTKHQKKAASMKGQSDVKHPPYDNQAYQDEKRQECVTLKM